MSNISPTRSEIENVENLALYAKRFDTEELWDSPEGVEAENELFDAVRPLLDSETYERLEVYCLKATLPERINAAVQFVRGQIERAMKKSYTYEEIAQSYTLWGKYADPQGIDSEDKFNELTVKEKVEILEACFGLDTSEFEDRENE